MSVWSDLRYAIRRLVKEKWFTTVAAVALALGIGVNATVFTFVNAVLVRGLPFHDQHEIMAVWGRNTERSQDTGVSYPDYRDWQAGTKTFATLAAFTGGTMNVSDQGQAPERLNGTWVTANAFPIVGQRAIVGRIFTDEDDRKGAEPVAVLSHSLWTSRYGADPAIVGRTIKINEVPTTVIGVMAEGYRFPNNADLWQPLVPTIREERRDARTLSVFGRLAKGSDRDAARAEMKTIAARLATQYPDTNKNIDALVDGWADRVNGGPIRQVFLALMGAVAFVLLIACANVANLLLARSAHRAREISVRATLGASRWRIVRQLLVESLLLAIVSGALGLGLAAIGIRLFDRAVADVGKPYWIQFTMDGTVFAFFAAVCLGTAMLFGLAPALHVSKTDVNAVLKEGGRSSAGSRRARRWTSALMVAELALTITLLTGAGLMMRSFLALQRLDIGIATDHLLTMRLTLADRKYPTPEQRLAFHDQLAARLAAVPGVEAASVASSVPMGGAMRRALAIDGRPVPTGERPPDVAVVAIGPRYFETVGAPILRGRAFSDTDGAAGNETAIVNQRFVTLYFKNEDPLGRRIQVRPPRGPEPKWLTIVGVSRAVRQTAFNDVDPDAVVYVPFRQDPGATTALIVRSRTDPGALTSTLRNEVRAVDADLPVYSVLTLDQFLAQQRWPYRVFGTMFTIFAIIALVLSAVGLYGLTAYSVSQRTQEIGVRMALGARGAQVWWLILRGVLVQIVVGVALGLGGALGVGKALSALLAQTGPRDPVTLVSVSLLLAAVMTVACVWPARRATRLDPMAALRVE